MYRTSSARQVSPISEGQSDTDLRTHTFNREPSLDSNFTVASQVSSTIDYESDIGRRTESFSPEDSSDPDSQPLISHATTNLSSSRPSPSDGADQIRGSQLQEGKNFTSSIRQPQTVNAISDRTHLITTGLLAKLLPPTAFSQILLSSRDQHRKTHDALKEILRDFEAGMTTGGTQTPYRDQSS